MAGASAGAWCVGYCEWRSTARTQSKGGKDWMQRRGKNCWVQVDVRVELDAGEGMHRVTKRRGKSDQRMKKRGIGAGSIHVSKVQKRGCCSMVKGIVQVHHRSKHTSSSVNSPGQNSKSSSKSKDLAESNLVLNAFTIGASVNSFMLRTPRNCR